MSLLFDEAFIAKLFLALIAATPVAAVVGALIHRAAAGRLSREAIVVWIVVALARPANFGLWRMFNAIEDHWGLDRTRPLLINFAVFVALGLAIGLLLRVLLRPRATPEPPVSMLCASYNLHSFGSSIVVRGSACRNRRRSRMVAQKKRDHR